MSMPISGPRFEMVLYVCPIPGCDESAYSEADNEECPVHGELMVPAEEN